ncbi:pyridoxamine 5'-phosphate oxidase-related FMN-binding protein [Sulfobacillus acidophilus TPY]|uniref:Pyridoxamine 5'-phosphate oxidase-related FMN-binding protein n=1 Tax=Sulfobacillus acidophilus (strain ATCC 700253 / DSM 10332 / NAL) TaxID=679936 RepID=G8TXP4_SULAD|nr:pyridoxamine 5'-phosphate oxidase-related FMN-binding protein [Sulfobacillus acidophilus TPY]AEW05000.1 pyridoxamine 5'-phosphate oxidase-related FMN-binding protein [Sulfobacillus acidophilus DSM 10332]
MAQFYPELTPQLESFISRQPVFFVATAPLSADGHINLSPKGYDSFRVITPNTVAYLDLTGSGNETSGHVTENGRITLMFCAFEGPPLILRIFGQGSVILPDHPEWVTWISRFPNWPGIRQIITVRISQVQTSCGYGVPLMTYQGPRNTLARWAEQKGPDGIRQYWIDHNLATIDQLPTPLAQHLDTLEDDADA